MSIFFFPVLLGAFLRFMSHRKHLLFSLLSLEGIIIALIVSISLSSRLAVSNLSLIIVFVLAVAEARLGLSVLVSITRSLDGGQVMAL